MNISDNIHFSIVTPLYNKEAEIQRTINSVLNQIYKNFEYIIIDDGSTDDSASIVKKNDDPRIKLIHQTNAGVSAARNKGIESSTYDYIAFLDADDTWKEDFLDTIHRLIALHPEAGAFATAYETITPNGAVQCNSIASLPAFPWEGLIPSYFRTALESAPVHTSAVVIPKRIIQDVGNFPLSTSMGEDRDLWERIALKYKIAYSTKIGSSYFLNSSNRISKSFFKKLRNKGTDSYSFILNRRPFYSYATELIKKNEVEKDILNDLKEYLEGYKLTSAELLIKYAKESNKARYILNNTFPLEKSTKRKKIIYYALSFFPNSIIHLALKIKDYFNR